MKLVHTLLFFLRPEKNAEDLVLAQKNLKSLEKSSYTTVVVYNQGPLSNQDVETFLRQFSLECVVIGNAVNVGISAGRQHCFEYVWDNYPDADFISEIHMDMIFAPHWEDAVLDCLNGSNEPVMSVGIVDQSGAMPFLDDTPRKIPQDIKDFDDFLAGLCCDKIDRGFTHPCIHNAGILKETGGYDSRFLKGKQCFEDDSLLLGYYYYYGTKADWHPKVNFNSVVYHAVALQRLDLRDSILPNLSGLMKQYGAMGLKSLSHLHECSWHKRFFEKKFYEMTL